MKDWKNSKLVKVLVIILLSIVGMNVGKLIAFGLFKFIVCSGLYDGLVIFFDWIII
jgi:hypothetical protein